MGRSSINIDVILDADRVPEQISWNATDTTAEAARKAKAMMLAFWDGAEKTALRIDLWTKDMMVDEMADFFYQTFMTMAETYHRATQDPALTSDMKQFAKDFYNKFREQQLKNNKA
jgi:gliding motility-associated protein GldC